MNRRRPRDHYRAQQQPVFAGYAAESEGPHNREAGETHRETQSKLVRRTLRPICAQAEEAE